MNEVENIVDNVNAPIDANTATATAPGASQDAAPKRGPRGGVARRDSAKQAKPAPAPAPAPAPEPALSSVMLGEESAWEPPTIADGMQTSYEHVIQDKLQPIIEKGWVLIEVPMHDGQSSASRVNSDLWKPYTLSGWQPLPGHPRSSADQLVMGMPQDRYNAMEKSGQEYFDKVMHGEGKSITETNVDGKAEKVGSISSQIRSMEIEGVLDAMKDYDPEDPLMKELAIAEDGPGGKNDDRE